MYEATMLDVEPQPWSLKYPLFDPRSLLASQLPLSLNANQLSVDEMATYASMASLIRERILTGALRLETEQGGNDIASNTRAEGIAKKI